MLVFRQLRQDAKWHHMLCSLNTDSGRMAQAKTVACATGACSSRLSLYLDREAGMHVMWDAVQVWGAI